MGLYSSLRRLLLSNTVLPVDRNYDTSPEKVRMICCECLYNVLKGFQGPGLIMNGSIKLICLKQKSFNEYFLWYLGSWIEDEAAGNKDKPSRGHSEVPGTWHYHGEVPLGPCRSSPSAQEHAWLALQLLWRLSQTSPTQRLDLGIHDPDPPWTRWGAALNWEASHCVT